MRYEAGAVMRGLYSVLLMEMSVIHSWCIRDVLRR